MTHKKAWSWPLSRRLLSVEMLPMWKWSQDCSVYLFPHHQTTMCPSCWVHLNPNRCVIAAAVMLITGFQWNSFNGELLTLRKDWARMGVWIDKLIYTCMQYGWMLACVPCMHAQIHRWTHGWVDGWMNGWMDGRMDRWIDRLILFWFSRQGLR